MILGGALTRERLKALFTSLGSFFLFDSGRFWKSNVSVVVWGQLGAMCVKSLGPEGPFAAFRKGPGPEQCELCHSAGVPLACLPPPPLPE